MSTRTRYFVIASLLVLFVGVGTGLVAYYTGITGALGASPGGTADLKLLPQNTQLVAYANVRELMASELRQKAKQSLPITGDGQRELFDLTGINVETDIEQVLVGVAPARPGQGIPVAPLVLARGIFGTSRIEGLMRQNGATVEEYKGVRLIVLPAHQNADAFPVQPASPTPSDNFTVAFLETGLAAIGPRSLVQAAVDQKAGGANLTSNTELMSLVQTLDQGDLWAVGRFDELTAHAQLPPVLAQQFPAITWFAANATVDSGVHGQLRADAHDVKAADDLREVIRGFIALGRLQAASHPELKSVLNSLTLSGTGTTVSLGFDVPGTLVDLLGSVAGQLQPRQRLPLEQGK